MAFNYHLYYTERAKNRVVCWNPDTGDIRVAAGGTQVKDKEQSLRDPYGLALDSKGYLLIADKRKNRICRVVKENLEQIRTHAVDGYRRSQFIPQINSPQTPTGIAVEKNGSLIVTYGDDFTLYRVSPDGALNLLLGVPANTPAVLRGYEPTIEAARVKSVPLNLPTAVTVSADGTIFFIERGYNVVRSYREGGDLVSVFSIDARRSRTNEEKLTHSIPLNRVHPAYPTSLAIDQDGMLYVADAHYGCIFQVDQKKSLVNPIMLKGENNLPSRPAAISFGPDNVLWILDAGVGRILGMEQRNGQWQPLATGIKTETDRLSCPAVGGAGLVCA